MQGKWSGTKWYIEGDIKSYFDEINHGRLIAILRKRIEDDRFVNLIQKFLNAGYIWEKKLFNTEKGTPQGGVISPVLANVYLHEFDLWVEALAEKLTKGKKRRASTEYRSLVRKRSYLLAKCDGKPSPEQAAKIEELESKIGQTPSVDVNDPNFVRVKYIRYADDWLIGVIGPKSLATSIKEEATAFSTETLKLELSAEKTKITHSSEFASFLGFDIGSPQPEEPKYTKYKAKGHENHTHRRINHAALVHLRMPKDKILRRLKSEGFIAWKDGLPTSTSKKSYVHLDPDDIVSRFNAVTRGIYNYYRPSANFGPVMGHIQYLLRYSLAKTLAHKYRTSMKHQFQQRGRSLEVIKEVKSGTRTIAYWQGALRKEGHGFIVNPRDPNAIYATYAKVTKSKLGIKECCVCGGNDRIQMHHLRHLRQGSRTIVKGFNRLMAQMNRKQIPVCHGCHVDIHGGRYDGISLQDLHLDPRYV